MIHLPIDLWAHLFGPCLFYDWAPSSKRYCEPPKPFVPIRFPQDPDMYLRRLNAIAFMLFPLLAPLVLSAPTTQTHSLTKRQRGGITDGGAGAALGTSIRLIICATSQNSFFCPKKHDDRPAAPVTPPAPLRAEIVPNTRPTDAAAHQWPKGQIPGNCVVQPSTSCQSGGGWFCGGKPNLVHCYWPAEVKACVYSDVNYQGAAKCYRETGYFNAPWNDQITSMTVKSGCTLKADKDGGMRGQLRDFTGNVPWVGNDFNDQISAFTITC